MRTTFTTAIVAGIASQAAAFWGTPHCLVARQAQAILADENPAVLQAALDLLAPLQVSQPTLTKKEGNNPFTECATFADDIKGQGYSFQSDWHYTNLPYMDQGGDISDYDFHPSSSNAVDALTDLTAFLKGEITAADSYYVTKIAGYFDDETDQKSFSLRLVIHYIGDLHQPLHTVAEVDATYPEGDRGGNDEKIPSQDGVNNLHFVWDSTIYDYTDRPNMPFDTSDWDWFTTEASTLYSQYPVDSSKIYPGHFDTWAQEGLLIAQDTVYPGFVTGSIPDSTYQEAADPVIKDRMMYGARRTADTMVDIFGTGLFLQ